MKPFDDPFSQRAETYSDEAGSAAGDAANRACQLPFIGHELWFFLEFPEVMRLAGRQAGFYKKSQAEDSFGLRKNPGSLQTNSPMHLLDKLEYGTTASYLNPILHSPFEENQLKSILKLCILRLDRKIFVRKI